MLKSLPKKASPKHVSASQLRTYTDCPRKWWIEKVGGISSPRSTAADFGVRVHYLLEKRLLHGEWREQPGDGPGRVWTNDREMEVALQQEDLLPASPVDPSCVETRWRIEEPYLALPLIGIMDWVEPELQRRSGPPFIWVGRRPFPAPLLYHRQQPSNRLGDSNHLRRRGSSQMVGAPHCPRGSADGRDGDPSRSGRGRLSRLDGPLQKIRRVSVQRPLPQITFTIYPCTTGGKHGRWKSLSLCGPRQSQPKSAAG